MFEVNADPDSIYETVNEIYQTHDLFDGDVICIDGKAHYIDTDCFREVGDFMQSRAELERKRQEELARQEWERIEAEECQRQQEEEQRKKDEEKAKQKSAPKKKKDRSL